MNIILLSGGSGVRLWPLSNEVRSKQFLKIFKTDTGTYESMIQRMCRMIQAADCNAEITIATSQKQVSSIYHQLGKQVRVSVEPCRRDTFPAIALASAFLEKNGFSRQSTVIVCPVDPYVNADYFECLKKLDSVAASGESNITLMGIEPHSPSDKFGYILPETLDEVSRVKAFKEKPSTEQARQYIQHGALWNGGIFAFQLGYLLDIAAETYGRSDYAYLLANYSRLEPISFDYAVVEKEKEISVIRFHGEWKDLGSWDTLPDAMDEKIYGNSYVLDCENTHVINELSVPLIAMGLNNAVVAATPDGILVTAKAAESNLKDIAAKVAVRPMFEERGWGEYKVLDYQVNDDGESSLTKELVIWPGESLSYQAHFERSEILTVIKGTGELLLDGKRRPIGRGESVFIERGVKYAIRACTQMRVIEIQIGENLREDDIERFPCEW